MPREIQKLASHQAGLKPSSGDIEAIPLHLDASAERKRESLHPRFSRKCPREKSQETWAWNMGEKK